jgi:hypothetical protein
MRTLLKNQIDVMKFLVEHGSPGLPKGSTSLLSKRIYRDDLKQDMAL